MTGFRPKKSLSRIVFLLVFTGFFLLVIIGKLFYLQIIKHSYYAAKAKEGHLGYTEIEPRRGEILAKDFHSGEIFRLATNATFDTLFADPTLIENPVSVIEKIAPLIFEQEKEQEKEKERIRLLRHLLPDKPTEAQLKELNLKSRDELFETFKQNLITKISQKTRQEILLLQNPDDTTAKAVANYQLRGIAITKDGITAYPPQIHDPSYTARILAPLVAIPYERLSDLLKGRNRYVVLHPKLHPSISSKIKKMIEFGGVGLREKTYRFYPEGSLLAQVLGFFSPNQGGIYGIEGRFNTQLQGEKGVFRTQLDASGRQVTVGNDVIIRAPLDGKDITLTIDRSIQRDVEERLSRTVKNVKADGGLVIIMEPSSGKIIAMAQYPMFDPNEFGKALDKEEISLTKEEAENLIVSRTNDAGEEIHTLILDKDSNYKLQVFKQILENGKILWEKFKNLIGPGVYLNKSVSEIFEPGSTFKVIAMAIALDASQVTPQTKYNDTGPIKVDEFEIHNALDTYYGVTDMTTVIAKSLNTGMAFVSRKIGRDLFYRYLRRFGFHERTDIEFDGEITGTLKEGSRWAESELVTYAFGQGIAVTPIQMITAVSALANKGIMMQPTMIEKIGDENMFEPRPIRKVISEKAADTIVAMMTNAVENGVARRAGVKGHYLGGKTGTAQTYKHGKPLTGPGTTIASFVGFAPIDKPKFVVLVKIDRPRTTIWADATAAPLFSEIAEFLFKYYNIPPDKKN